MAKLQLIRDVLDNRLLDRNGRHLGRVDGLIAEYKDDGSARVTGIEVSHLTLARRVHPLLERFARRLPLGTREPFVISIDKVTEIGIDVIVDVDFEISELTAFERRLERWISRLPGAR